MDIKEQIRTLGDGMDSLDMKSEKTKSILNVNLNIKPSKRILKSLQPVHPSKIVHLVPKYVPREQKRPKYLVKKPKEPKFIPCEPYKAAVDPIKPIKTPKKAPQTRNKSNDIEIQDLVTQISEFRTAEMNKHLTLEPDKAFISKDIWAKEKAGYENDIKNLRETTNLLENQLKLQAQVNSELKTLLVAAVGEDLETRVQHLTEDKLQLARALLNSANHLTSHQEHTEWLSGQCEVWRSKFLASSLMVEELARWKSALTSKCNDLQDTLKLMMEERAKIQKLATKSFNQLRLIKNKISNQDLDLTLKSGNNLELANNNLDLSNSISKAMNLNEIELPNNFKSIYYTPAEKLSLKCLQNPLTLSTKPDEVCNAVMGAATNANGQQMFLQHPSLHVTCCAHCKGQIENV